MMGEIMDGLKPIHPKVVSITDFPRSETRPTASVGSENLSPPIDLDKARRAVASNTVSHAFKVAGVFREPPGPRRDPKAEKLAVDVILKLIAAVSPYKGDL